MDRVLEKYAIAVKDSDNIFLFFEICREITGDIYLNANEQKCNQRESRKHLHWSKHASGQLHSKSHGFYLFPNHIKKTQAPDNMFKGAEIIATTSIRKGDGRACNVICRRQDYSEIMIIEDELIVPEFGYQLNIEIIEPGIIPWIETCPYVRIIQQQTFSKIHPQIIVSLYEMSDSKS